MDSVSTAVRQPDLVESQRLVSPQHSQAESEIALFAKLQEATEFFKAHIQAKMSAARTMQQSEEQLTQAQMSSPQQAKLTPSDVMLSTQRID
jgi:hypothetical protein